MCASYESRFSVTQLVKAFEAAQAPLLALAAIWREGKDGLPDAFSLLTAEPGEDVRPYHDRGVIPLPASAWADWLFDRRPAEDLLVPPPPGTLVAAQQPRKPAGQASDL